MRTLRRKGLVNVVHVLPINDLIAHEENSDECVCGPAVEHVKSLDGDGWVIIHHSLDGRERYER